jgi:hypothetical protein
MLVVLKLIFSCSKSTVAVLFLYDAYVNYLQYKKFLIQAVS